MFLIFINVVGIVMFLLLRWINKEWLLFLFVILRGVFVLLMYVILLLYVFVKFVLGMWLFEYSESLKFMGILFFIVIYEGWMFLLINMYLKMLRKEKIILFVNVLIFVLLLILLLFVIFVVGNLNLIVGLILVSLVFCCNLVEIFLCKDMNIKIGNSIVLEMLVILLFIFSNFWFGGSIYSFIFYVIVYIIYFLFIYKSFVNNVKNLKYLVKGWESYFFFFFIEKINCSFWYLKMVKLMYYFNWSGKFEEFFNYRWCWFYWFNFSKLL